jgi:HemY protein
VRLAPDLVPAAALAARQLSRKGDLRRAAKIVEAAWREISIPSSPRPI